MPLIVCAAETRRPSSAEQRLVERSVLQAMNCRPEHLDLDVAEKVERASGLVIETRIEVGARCASSSSALFHRSNGRFASFAARGRPERVRRGAALVHCGTRLFAVGQ